MAQPLNNDIEDAIVIAGDGFSYSGSTRGATPELGEPEPYYADLPLSSVWFVYTPSAGDETGFDVTTSSGYSIAFYRSDDGSDAFSSLSVQGSGTSWGGGTSGSYLYPTLGYTYYIQITGANVAYTITQVSGSAGVDLSWIYGTSAADVLGTPFDGAKTMTGGLGDDAYYVDSASDVVTEDANGGFDTIYTLADYALPANVEKIVALGATGLTLTGNALDNQLFGAAGADTLIGGDGDDRLDGRGGADSLSGGDGDDSYVVGDAGDVVVELADEGYDTVYTTVNYTASANVEKIVARGSTGLQLTGNGSDNVITGGVGDDRLDGGAGADRINGGGGDDVLIGGAGKDVLTGGAGADLFVFAGVGDAGDTIADFQVGLDRVGLELAGFGLSGFDATMFESNARGLATGAETRFVYSESNGRLFFDADGSGAGKAVLLATLRGAPDLTADDFQVTSLIG